MAKLKKSSRNKPKYSAGEKRAYWVGVGFHSARSLGMNSDELKALMSQKEMVSFGKGRSIADSLSDKFVPELVSGNRGKRKNKTAR